MYPQHHYDYASLVIFGGAGALLFVLGRWLKARFRDPNEGSGYFQHMTVTPRGLLEFTGVGMMYFGVISFICAFLFAFVF